MGSVMGADGVAAVEVPEDGVPVAGAAVKAICYRGG
jgi:hypothetical protein